MYNKILLWQVQTQLFRMLDSPNNIVAYNFVYCSPCEKCEMNKKEEF